MGQGCKEKGTRDLMPTPKKPRDQLKRPQSTKEFDTWTEEEKQAYLKRRKKDNPNFTSYVEFGPEKGRKQHRPKGTKKPIPVTPENKARNEPVCGAERRNHPTSNNPGGLCMQTAGWGTDHPGVGACKYHGGSVRTHGIKAMREEVMRKAVMYGAPKDISPDAAIIQELERTAGHIGWLSDIISSMTDKSELMRLTQVGIQKDPFLTLYQQEREHLVKVAKVAKDMGIEERRVRLAEDQGKLIAMVLMNFIRDPELRLTQQQQTVAKVALRKHLLSIDTTAVEVTPNVELPARKPKPVT